MNFIFGHEVGDDEVGTAGGQNIVPSLGKKRRQ